jgi:hypothetical protein
MGGGGRVTRIVGGRVREEARTRQLENEIMDEIARSPGGSRHGITLPTPAGGLRPPSGAGRTARQARQRWWAQRDVEVERSFESGLPRLTYQESFIVEEMTAAYQVPGVDQRRAVQTARDMVATQMIDLVRQSNRSTFVYDDTMVNFQRTRAAGARPAGPTTVWGPGPSPGQLAQQASGIFWTWFQTLPPGFYDTAQGTGQVTLTAQGRRAMHLFEWALIGERMSSEWERLGADTPAPQILREHLLFLSARVGRGLQGLPTPP